MLTSFVKVCAAPECVLLYQHAVTELIVQLISFITNIKIIIIYLCMETPHYCLLTGGALKITSGPLWS